MMLLLSGVGVEVVSVSLVLKESQSDAVELKPWMTISDLYGRLTVKFIHAYSVNDWSFNIFMTYCYPFYQFECLYHGSIC